MLKRLLRVAVITIAGAILVAGGSAAYLCYAPRRTPETQPPLTSIQEGDIKPFEGAFDAANDSTRIVALLSPT